MIMHPDPFPTRVFLLQKHFKEDTVHLDHLPAPVTPPEALSHPPQREPGPGPHSVPVLHSPARARGEKSSDNLNC